MCLKREPYSDDNIELELHYLKVHFVKIHLKELVEICTEAEEREEREGWSLDDILEEERVRREAEAKNRAGGGCLGIFHREKRTPECLDNNAEVDGVDCFLCQKQLKSCEYNVHLEKQHGVIFGVKDIKGASKKYESVPVTEMPDHNNEEDLEISRTDAVIVKELVEKKFSTKKRKIGPRRLFSKNYQVLIEEL